jgi:cytochrome c2
VWQFTGYFHSALSNAALFLCVAGVLSAAYSYARYGKGMFAAFPAGFGFVFLAKTALFIYAINSFRERTPGLIAAAIFLAIVAAYWLIVRKLRSRERRDHSAAPASKPWWTAGFAGVLALVAFGLTMPYMLFRVTPFATGVMVKEESGITWHQRKVAEVDIPEATEFELTTGQETYKWCQFCHTMQEGKAHLLGPNLHNIFGQQAGTVPNFHYSPALAKAGEEGLVWTEETIIQYIAGPDEMIPGTSMIISSGPVTDPEIQQAVINALKRDTMGGPTESAESK